LPYHLSISLLGSILALCFGVALIALARSKRNQWISGNAVVVSVESRDSDWDLLQLRLLASGRQVVTTIAAPSQLGYARRSGESIPILYNPAEPSQMCLPSSRGKLHIVGVFLLAAGSICSIGILLMSWAT
jgi:uncharacterized protein DUF3592